MTEAAITQFIYHEARLLDEKRWDEWYELFTEDGHYWVPLTRDQPDADLHTSLAYEDKLLLRLRIERLPPPAAVAASAELEPARFAGAGDRGRHRRHLADPHRIPLRRGARRFDADVYRCRMA